MSPHPMSDPFPARDLAQGRRIALALMAGGGALAVTGLVLRPLEFGYAWLMAYLVCVGLPLGALFLVMMHHLFDAGWSVPLRRTYEHLACLSSPVLLVLWVPVGVLAPQLYPWMRPELQGQSDPALAAQAPRFGIGGFYAASLVCFAVWHLVSGRLRAWSLRQDATGAAECTYALRRWSAAGLFPYAATVTLAAILWMKALSGQWVSTMYGVYSFCGSVWFALANVYVITLWLERTGLLRYRLRQHQYSLLGALFFAFTVFYAYIHFSQYFVIWNANVPRETFWYQLREQGSWHGVGVLLIFGHFLFPFLALLRMDAKHCFPLMVGLWGWSWLMHSTDVAFNVLPLPHPDGVPWRWLWLPVGCLAFMAGVMWWRFLVQLERHAPYPTRDPRLAESMGLDCAPPVPIPGGILGGREGIGERRHRSADGAPSTGGGI